MFAVSKWKDVGDDDDDIDDDDNDDDDDHDGDRRRRPDDDDDGTTAWEASEAADFCDASLQRYRAEHDVCKGSG